MKTKSFFIILLMSLLTTASWAQFSYVNFKTGVQLPFAGSYLTDLDGNYTYSTYATAVPLHLSFGYMVEKHIGGELGVTTAIGIPFKIADRTVTAFQVRIEPTVYLVTGEQGMDYYAKFGVVLVPLTKLRVEEPLPGSILYTDEIKGFSSVGLKGAFGMMYEVSDNVFVYGEVESINLSVRQKSSLKVGGLFNEYTRSTAPVLPYHSIGIQVGVRIAFGEFGK